MPDPIDLRALAAALRDYVARGCGHWRVDKLLQAVERAADDQLNRETRIGRSESRGG